MFEFGRVYSTGIFKNEPLPGYHEEKHLAVVITGRRQPENWNAADDQVDFYDLKAHLDGIFNILGIIQDDWQAQPFHSARIDDGMEYLINGKTIFTIGPLSHQVLKTFDCRQPVYFAELNWGLLLSLIPKKNIQYQGVPKFPEVRRDLALVVDQAVTFAQIKKLAFQTEKKLLKNVGLFDVYDGEKIAAGKKSYAMNFILQDEDKTLTDKEIEKSMDKLLRAFVSGFNAQLR